MATLIDFVAPHNTGLEFFPDLLDILHVLGILLEKEISKDDSRLFVWAWNLTGRLDQCLGVERFLFEADHAHDQVNEIEYVQLASYPLQPLRWHFEHSSGVWKLLGLHGH